MASQDDLIAYFTDWDTSAGSGTLQIKKIGQEDKTVIGEEIHSYTFTNEGDILYLNEYSLKYSAGVLHSYDISANKSERVTYDVTALIDIVESFGLERSSIPAAVPAAPAAYEAPAAPAMPY